MKYRRLVNPEGLVPFQVRFKESNLLILAERDLSSEAVERLVKLRGELDEYVERHPLFVKSLVPLPFDEEAPQVVKRMLKACSVAGVGPMAAVAGAVAEELGRFLVGFSKEVIVENGGDIYLRSSTERVVSVYAGSSPFSGRIGIRLPAGEWGVATSSGTVGHSLSFGRADAAVVVSPSAALSDAFATALGNRVEGEEDIEQALRWISDFEEQGVLGALLLVGGRMGAWGKIELVKL